MRDFANRHGVNEIDALPPFKEAADARSRSSASVSCDQPPASTTASCRQMPPYHELEGQSTPGAGGLLHSIMARLASAAGACSARRSQHSQTHCASGQRRHGDEPPVQSWPVSASRWCAEIRIKHSGKGRIALGKSGLQGTGLVAGAVCPTQMRDVKTARL